MRGKKLSVKEREAKLARDKNERRKIFKELCDHVRGGLSLQSFGPLSDTSIYTYLKTYPEEFCKEELDEAIRNGRDYWEGLGKKQADGSCLGNSRTWYYNMANRYGWREKLEVEAEHKGQVNVNVVSYATMKASKDNSED